MATTAARGRPAKPRGLKLLEGGENKLGEPIDSKGRKIKPDVGFTRGLPEKPADLSEDAEYLWDKIIEQLESVGVLKPLDAASLEMACETYSRWRYAVKQRRMYGALGKNSQGVVTAPWVGIEERASKEFRSWCAEFGLTPASEKNLTSEEGSTAPDAYNPF
jgi:P27 family predicted phage terminase small subunit